jgi:hypothetical protein
VVAWDDGGQSWRTGKLGGGDLMGRTRESLAREYQLAKYYLGNGKNWGVSGRWER